jgi:hypothetical protein
LDLSPSNVLGFFCRDFGQWKRNKLLQGLMRQVLESIYQLLFLAGVLWVSGRGAAVTMLYGNLSDSCAKIAMN